MGGAVEVNVTFYLVETFTSVSVSIQRPVVMRAVEVEIGTTLRELLTQRVTQGPIAHIFSNSGV